MSLTEFRTLGRSGLVVSPLALGTMTFGSGEWGADEAEARRVFQAYREAGGNFVDTADIYAGGESERLVGQFIREAGARDEVVLSTKFAFNGSASPLTTAQAGRGNPNAGGAGAKNIHRALDASLQRLGTDYVDLYWMHIWDGVTPVEEIVQTLGDLVCAGKIRYFALSDMPAWLAMKAATLAVERRAPAPIAIQVEYSLVARDIEAEHIPAALEGGMGVMPWSPLAGGFLTGKYRREDTTNTGRLSGANPFGQSKFVDRNWDVLETLKAVAKENRSIAGAGGAEMGDAAPWRGLHPGRRAHRGPTGGQYRRRRVPTERRTDVAFERRQRPDAGLHPWSDGSGDPPHGLWRQRRVGLARIIAQQKGVPRSEDAFNA